MNENAGVGLTFEFFVLDPGITPGQVGTPHGKGTGGTECLSCYTPLTSPSSFTPDRNPTQQQLIIVAFGFEERGCVGFYSV
jgi:hypothetical protein